METELPNQVGEGLEQIRLPGRTWQQVSRGLVLKLIGQALGGLAVAGVLLSSGPQQLGRLLPLLAVLCCVGVGFDGIGRVLCLAAPRDRRGGTRVIQSVIAQAVAVAAAVGALDWPIWQNNLESAFFRTVLVLLALLSQFTAALFFTGFLRELAANFGQPGLSSLGETLHRVLWILAVVTAVGLTLVVVVAAVVFLVCTILIFGFGAAIWGGIAGVIVSIPFLLAVVVLAAVIEIWYMILVFRLAIRTSQAAKELRALETSTGAHRAPDALGNS